MAEMMLLYECEIWTLLNESANEKSDNSIHRKLDFAAMWGRLF